MTARNTASENKLSLIEGVAIKQLVKHKDERGYFEELIRLPDQFFTEGFGQLSRSFMFAGVIKAWHIHKTQVDWWFVSKGDLKVVLYDMRPQSKTYKRLNEFLMGENSQEIILRIPAGVAHGCKVLGDCAELFYITSSIYNPDEEGRFSHDDLRIGYDWLKPSPIK